MANVNSILRQVYGARGLPFPASPSGSQQRLVAPEFTGAVELNEQSNRTQNGTPLWGVNDLGRPVFMPARLGGIQLQNPLFTVSGEHSIIETDVTEIGTVFEKVFQRPYDISIICTLLNKEGVWPEEQLAQMIKLFTAGVLYTLECAVTDMVLQPKNNFILQKMDILDMQGIENAQVVQLSGRSNKDFELVIK